MSSSEHDRIYLCSLCSAGCHVLPVRSLHYDLQVRCINKLGKVWDCYMSVSANNCWCGLLIMYEVHVWVSHNIYILSNTVELAKGASKVCIAVFSSFISKMFLFGVKFYLTTKINFYTPSWVISNPCFACKLLLWLPEFCSYGQDKLCVWKMWSKRFLVQLLVLFLHVYEQMGIFFL